MRILMIGDIFGDAGVKAALQFVPGLRDELSVDLCVANGENASPRGVGLNKSAANALLSSGIDVLTLGNHTFRDFDTPSLLKSGAPIIRPANYPLGVPGEGSTIVQTPFGQVGIINLMGRLYIDSFDCPFLAADRELAHMRHKTNMILIDIHGEATSEKCALAWYLDGRVSFVCGTHTHVQTADERILQNGTAYITDVGMTGPADGIIGVERDIAIRKFRTLMPERFAPAVGRVQLSAALADIDPDTGRALSIERIVR